MFSFFFQAEDGIRVHRVTGVQTCAFRSKTFYGSCNLPLLVNDFEFLIFLKELNNPILVSYVEDYYSLTREQRDNKMKSYINFITFMLNKTNLNLVFNTFSYECLMSHLLVSTDINYLNEDSL